MPKTLLRAADLAALCTRIQALTPEHQRLWGTMSVEQMMAHCSDQIRIAFGELPCKDISTFFMRNVVKWLVLYVMPIPKNVKTARELDFKRGGGTPPSAEWEAERQTLLRYVEALATTSAPLSAHPAFGSMSQKQWAILSWAHVDYHLRQFGA